MMQGRNPSYWSMNSLMPPSQQISNLLASSSPSSSSLSSDFPKFSKGAGFSSMIPCHETQELPESWSQLLLGGLVEEEEEGCTNYAPYTAKRVENWEYQGLCASANGHMATDVKQEDSGSEVGKVLYYGRDHQEPDLGANKSSWSSQAVAASSPRSCITTSFSSNFLDFSNCKSQKKQLQASDHSSECNGSSAAFKKARVQASSAQSPLKVRKEKLGDRIATLHQIVSPFGKTDTASVLQEASGYIRFLHGQIEALSSPYLGRGQRNSTKQQCLLKDGCIKRRDPPEQGVGEDDEEGKDLRSRGLCLVPVSFTLQVGAADNGADYWAPNFGMAFR